MSTVTLSISGGDKLAKYLKDIAQRLGSGGEVSVGFNENAKYPVDLGLDSVEPPKRVGGKSAKSKRKAHRKAAVEQYVAQVAFWNEFGTTRSPPRPFFRTMISQQSPSWGPKLAAFAKATNYDTGKTLGLMGENIKDDLVNSIRGWTQPPNAPSTVAIKGFNRPLNHSGIMEQAPSYEVKTK